MSFAGCQTNPIDVNFHLQKSLKITDKNLADKIWSKKEKGMEIALPQANTGSWVKIEHFHSIVKETRNRTEIQCTNSYFLCWNVHLLHFVTFFHVASLFMRIGGIEKLSFFFFKKKKKICFIPMKISQSVMSSKDGSKFWWLPWFAAKE